jgi:hypothetical protein
VQTEDGVSNGSVDAILVVMRIFGISAALRPFAVVVLSGFLGLALPLQALADAYTDYAAEKEARLRSGLSSISEERTVLRSAFSAQEQQCLRRFVSAACLEDVRQAQARAMRELDLAQEMLNLEIRQLHAEGRQRSRQQAMARHVQSLAPKEGLSDPRYQYPHRPHAPA